MQESIGHRALWAARFWSAIEHNVPGRPRHPAVVMMNTGCALATATVWLAWLAYTRWLPIETQIFLAAQLHLYCASARFHREAETVHTRFVDQASIAVFILFTPLPFIWHKPEAVSLVMIAAIVMICFKRLDREGHWVCSGIFFGCGVVALSTYLIAGRTLSGELVNLVFGLSVFGFVLKLMTHTWGYKPWPGYVEKSELGHPILALAIILFDYHVLTGAVR